MNVCDDCKMVTDHPGRCVTCQVLRDQGWFVDGYGLNHRHHVDKNGAIHRSHHPTPCWSSTPGSRFRARVRRAKRACAHFFHPTLTGLAYAGAAAIGVLGLIALLLVCMLVLWSVTRGLTDVLAWIA